MRKHAALLSAGGLAISLLLPASPASAAPTRYEAESATISQGVVEANHLNYSGTGFVNGDNVVGSYTQWTVNAANAGTATITIRYSNGTTTNRPADIAVNGTVVAAASAFNSTTNWDTWANKTLTAPVNAGSNTIRVTGTTATGPANLDYLDFEVATLPPPASVYQAEDGTISQGLVESNHTGYTGAGFVNLDNVVGSYVEWTATVEAAGTTSLTIRHANGTTANRPMSVTVNGTVVNANLAFNPTGAWTTWADVSLNITLNAGANTIRVTSTTATGGPNLDKITLGVASSPSPTPTPTATTSPPPGGTPVSINGQLHVCGLKLCNQYNQPIQLRGMSTHGLQWYKQCVNNASLTALATDWTADVLRISMYIQEGGYETDPRGFTDLVHSIIEQVTARGMYAIVDWHQLSPGDPNYNLSRAKTFFTEIAQRHKDKVNILYDVANEPNGVSWATVKNYHEQIIPVIRAQDPDSVILLGTHGWGSFGISDGRSPSDIINNPVNATNIMYTFHFYAASHGTEYLNALNTGSNSFPVFVTEFGTQTASGDGSNNFTRSQQYIDLMASKKISWVNWNYSDDNRSGAVFTSGTCPNGPFAGTSRLKPAGVWVRDHIRTPADNFPTS